MSMLRRGVESRDAELLARLYGIDAELLIVDESNPPSRPRVLRGINAIADYLRDVYARDMSHSIENVIASGSRIAFTQSCRYADGTCVLAANIADLEDGVIVSQTVVQAWDS
ncbi:MAG: nuclear transport factor 2 family protein [Bacteroidetes bacterium]|nr:nuclear transport factor 2 family protein [Bacteroidota bacterium]